MLSLQTCSVSNLVNKGENRNNYINPGLEHNGNIFVDLVTA